MEHLPTAHRWTNPPIRIVPVNSIKTGTIPASRILKPLWRLTCRSSPVLLNDKAPQHSRVFAIHGCPQQPEVWLHSIIRQVLWRYRSSLYRVHWIVQSNVSSVDLSSERPSESISDEGLMLETLDLLSVSAVHRTFFYFDLYLNTAYAAHYIYFINWMNNIVRLTTLFSHDNRVAIQLFIRLTSKEKLLTQYMMSVHPSFVITWKTANIPRKILSKLVIPSFGPSQRGLHRSVPGQTRPPLSGVVQIWGSSGNASAKWDERTNLGIIRAWYIKLPGT